MTLFSQLQTLTHNFFRQYSEEKLVCYHCDDRMRQSKAVPILFDGQTRQVCCHGCAAILVNIQKHQLIADYYASKNMSQHESI
jgi:hypothetical protein